ncbi:hypothetical protein [Mumia sp. DW29H23]|uniref:hypothetical protein n=1 Tax=Mumia sp. DW29H23 TaxID=3421241 RepID=UPI003D68FE0E
MSDQRLPRVLIVPTIADAAAPTMAELNDGIDIGSVLPDTVTFSYAPTDELDPHAEAWDELYRRLDAGEQVAVLAADGTVIAHAQGPVRPSGDHQITCRVTLPAPVGEPADATNEEEGRG